MGTTVSREEDPMGVATVVGLGGGGAAAPAGGPGLPTLAETLDALAALSGAVSGATAVLAGSLPGCAAEIRKARDAALELLHRARPLFLADLVGVPAESITHADIAPKHPLVLVNVIDGVAEAEVFDLGEPSVVVLDWDAMKSGELTPDDWEGFTEAEWNALEAHASGCVSDLAERGFTPDSKADTTPEPSPIGKHRIDFVNNRGE